MRSPSQLLRDKVAGISSANVSAIKAEPLALGTEAAFALGLWHLRRASSPSAPRRPQL
jgi:hypothetical protein